MSSIPLPALAVNPPPQQPNSIDQYSRLAQLKGLLQQQQLAPLQVQQAQNEAQSSGIDLQQKQLAIKNQQITQSVLADPNFQQDFKDWQSSKSTPAGSSSSPAAGQPAFGGVQLHPLAQFLVEKKGLPIVGPGGAMDISNSLVAGSQKMADLAKTQGEAGTSALKNHSDQLDNFDNLVEPILAEKDPVKQFQGISNLQTEIAAHPDLYPPEATQHLDKLNSVQGLQTAANTSQVRQMLIDDATKSANAAQKTTAAAPPSQQQILDATNTLATYKAIPQNMRDGLTAEIQHAPDYETLQKVQDRADAANESFQRSADARQQASAMRDVGVQTQLAGKLATEDQKLGASLDQTTAIRSMLDMSQGGNQQATAAAQQLFAEHIVMQGGIKRFNELEQQGLIGNMGSWGRQLKTWLDKGAQGAMPAATNSDMNAILDAEDKTANAAHQRNVGTLVNRFSDISGVKTPNSVQRAQSRQQTPVASNASGKTPAPAATHQVMNRADGKMHWTDQTGKQDLGVVQ